MLAERILKTIFSVLNHGPLVQLYHNKVVESVRNQQRELASTSDNELRKKGLLLRYDAMSGVPIRNIIPQGFALVVEAANRVLAYSHFDVQIFGGLEMVFGRIAEMKTGEGKTLTGALPVFMHALTGRGAHVVTVNDYLAKRDCELIGPIYEALGLSVAYIEADDPPEKRFEAYRKDITYGSAKEFGFDFLRDRLKKLSQTSHSTNTNVLRPLNFALVDEADSILIDEARTPLIIGMIDQEEETVTQDCFSWAAKHSADFVENQDFQYDHLKQKVNLTLSGRNRLRQLPQTSGTKVISIHELYDYMQNAIKVRRDFQLDKNYAIVDEKIVIIDEFTGRPAEGRQWQQGIHQSVEAKEKVPITPATRQAATITIQNFFRRYRFLSGMTGTAWTSRREFKKVFKKKVVRIPCNRPIDRAKWPAKIFGNIESKFEAIAKETAALVQQNRSILIGTRSVAKSELLSAKLSENQVVHQVLNARFLEKEADIIARAGMTGCVTVATNMAGRGTDIKLDQLVTRNGGLHVILTEIHESKRIDWQLIGRGSRQGDPGSFRIHVSLDDEILLVGLGPAKAKKILERFKNYDQLPGKLFRLFRIAQNKIERKHLVDRMILLRQDKERQERLFESGSDPFLDVVD